MPQPLQPAERRLRGLLWAHAALSVAFAAGYVAGGDVHTLGFIPNSVAKDGLFAILSVLGAADVRRRGWAAPVLAGAYVCLIAGEAIALVHGGAPGQDVLGLLHVSGSVALLAWMAVDVLLAFWLVAWWLAAERARLGLRYLNPIAFHGLAALADVLIEGADEKVPPAEVARNVDEYFARLEATGKARVRLALTALGLIPPWLPLPLRSPEGRKRFLQRNFIDDVSERRLPRPVRPFVQALVRTASQMAYLGYYGDERSWPSIGYVPFAQRPGGRAPAESDHAYGPLETLPAPPRTRYDTVIVGSGAAGSILAYRFAERGKRVLLLERGPYADPREFTGDEVQQYLKLYNEGALTLATDFRLQVLQGMCVGGGTTVNNAVCLDPPGPVLDRWAQRGIPRDGLEQAVGEVRRWLGVGQIPLKTVSAGAQRFSDGVAALRLPGTLRRVDANLLDSCLGCGYCNIGCAYGQRISMLDRILPEAQRFANGGRVDVLPRFRALEIIHDGDRATGVIGEHAGRERAFVGGDEVIVAAGALGSSWLLQRSGIGGDRVGQDLHFNINSPLTADFPDPVDTFAGLQMTHAYEPPGDEPGYVLETWFNPPATQSLAMPGWFDRHYRNMLRYRHMVAGGALVGTTTPARVTATPDGPQVHYTPSAADLGRVVDGIALIGRIYLAAGAERVMPATFAWREYRSQSGLDDLRSLVRDNSDLLLTTAHPQGGNAIGAPGQGVVGPDFRVHGFANLYLCDASAFPSSVGVNPQLTVMALAQLASHSILGAEPVPLRRVA